MKTKTTLLSLTISPILFGEQIKKLLFFSNTNNRIKTILFSLTFLFVGINAKAQCSMTTLGAAGSYSIATVATSFSGCSGTLTIPNGYTLDLDSTTAMPPGITQIDVLNGGSIKVTVVSYTFAGTITKISLLDSDFVSPSTPGPLPSGNINFGQNSFLTLASGTLLFIQNTFTLQDNPGGAIFTGGPCSQAVRIYIGNDPYAACNNPNGAGVCFTYNEVVKNGGTPQLSGDVTVSGTGSGNNVCFNNQPFNLNATLIFSVPFTNAPTFTWSQVSGPGTSTFGADTNPSTTATTNPTTVTAPGTYVYRITLVQNLSVAGCDVAANITLTRDVPVVIIPTPNVTISGTTTTCIGTSNPNITFTNPTSKSITATYNSPTASGLTITINANSNATIPVSTTTAGTYTYTLVSASYTAPELGCTQSLSGSATVTVTPNNTVTAASSTPTLCINTLMTNITHTTTGATGIGSVTGLPAGVTVTFESNTITISGTPTASGIFNYSIPLTGGCGGGNITATGTITVNPTPNAVATPASQTICSTATITPIVLSGNVTGTTFNWTRDNASVTGIADSGSGDISGNLINTTNAPVTVTFTITPTANGCPGTPITATVLVNPTPNAPISGGNLRECKNPSIQTLTATAIVPAGQHIDWYADATGGNPISSPTLNTIGTVTYYAQAVNDETSCISLTRTPITLTISECSIAIVKTNNIVSVNGCADIKVGDVVTYTFTVTNPGNVSLHNITVLDPHPGLSAITMQGGDTNTDGILDINETWVYKATYTVTQADIDTGSITNQASVNGTAPDNITIKTDLSGDSETEDGENVIPICTNPKIAIVKTNDIIVGTNGCADLKVGDVVTYTFTVTNPGNVSLHNITVLDPHTGLSAIAMQGGDTNTNDILEVNETWTYKATYAVTQADIDTGSITNQASVNGTAPNNTTIVTDQSGDLSTNDNDNVIPICTNPKIAIVKTNDIIVGTNGCADLNVGDVVTYTFTVTNPGNVSLHNITVLDPHTGLSAIAMQGGDTNTNDILEVNETWTYQATYTATQTDIDNGKITNQASVNGTAPNNTTIVTDQSGDLSTNDNDNVIPICTNPKIAIVKTNDIIVGTNGCADLNVGDVVTYTFTVTNPGNVSLHNISVLDPHTGLSAIAMQGGDTNTNDILEVSETWTYQATYTATQTDIDNGKITNQASVNGTAPNNTTIVTDQSGDLSTNDNDNVIPICTNPKIAIVKTNDIIVGTNGCADLKVGDVVTYTFTVTNPGNVSLHNISVLDPHTGLSAIAIQGGDTNTNDILEVSETWTYKATYTVTQADIDTGSITNQASVNGTAPNNTTIVTDQSGDLSTNDNPNVIPICNNPKITFVKTGVFSDTNNDGFAQVDEIINYTFTVTNTGNVVITNIIITDPLAGLVLTGNPIASLAPGATSSVTGVYKITQADIDAGKVTNSAIASGKDPKDGNVSDTSGTAVDNDTPTVTLLNNVKTIPTSCTSSTETLNLNDFLPANTPTNGTWTDLKATGHLAGSIVSPFGLEVTTENNLYVFEYQVAEGSSTRIIRLLMGVDNSCFVLDCDAIVVHNAFSPDGDGINETFEIDNISDTCYTDNTVEIYNRWGILVFETKNYNNLSNYFDGTSKGRTTISQSSGLPSGTYFYIINYTSKDGSGNIQINRKEGYLYLTR